MPENPTSMPEPSGENTAEVVAGKNDAKVPETPAEPLGGVFVYPGDRSRRLADALSIPTIPSDARAFQRFLFRSHIRRSQEEITTAESGF